MQTRFTSISTASLRRRGLQALTGCALAAGLFFGVLSSAQADTTKAKADTVKTTVKPAKGATKGALKTPAVAPATTSTDPNLINSPEYVLGPDDQLSISAVGIDEVADRPTVASDGNLHIKGIPGAIHAQGMT